MDMNKQNGFSYANEPANYQEARESILSLMRNLTKAKKDMKAISELDIVVEQFQERTREIIGELSQAVYSLGEIYGYTLSDDILENVELVNEKCHA